MISPGSSIFSRCGVSSSEELRECVRRAFADFQVTGMRREMRSLARQAQRDDDLAGLQYILTLRRLELGRAPRMRKTCVRGLSGNGHAPRNEKPRPAGAARR